MHGNFDGEEFGQAIVESIKAGLRRSNSQCALRRAWDKNCAARATQLFIPRRLEGRQDLQPWSVRDL